MSSHHIVRDAQEPALLILSAQLTEHQMLPSLLEWSPVVLCAAKNIPTYLSMGHKLDVALVGLEETVFWEKKLEAQFPVKILSGESDLAVACAWLLENGHQMLNVLTDPDTLNGLLKSAEEWLDRLGLVILVPEGRCVPVKTGIFEKWYPKGQILRINKPPKELTGAQEIGQDVSWITCHVAEEGFVQMKAHKELIWVMEAR